MSEGALPDKVVLIGFMAAGKSSVGPPLAERLGYAFVDLDEQVERLAGRTIPEIFDAEGEGGFRALEAAACEHQDAATRVVIATGGGWMGRLELRDRWPDAVRVWLRVDRATALERLAGEAAFRPMLGSEQPARSATRLMRDRAAAYELAEISVNGVEASPVETADLIADLLRSTWSGAPASHRAWGDPRDV